MKESSSENRNFVPNSKERPRRFQATRPVGSGECNEQGSHQILSLSFSLLVRLSCRATRPEATRPRAADEPTTRCQGFGVHSLGTLHVLNGGCLLTHDGQAQCLPDDSSPTTSALYLLPPPPPTLLPPSPLQRFAARNLMVDRSVIARPSDLPWNWQGRPYWDADLMQSSEFHDRKPIY